MRTTRLLIWLLIAIVAAFVVNHAVQRDLRYEKEYTQDLRNRVVGARLVEDGIDPYFYKWRTKDGVRYYDRYNFNPATFSNITVSPFFLHLLSPLADRPEATLSRYELLFEYGAFILITLVCLTAAATPARKQMVLVFAVLFLLTNGWKQHVANGQMYLFIPLLASFFYVCIRRRTAWIWGALAGGCVAGLVLTRINTIFLFLPFLLLLPAYGRRWLIAFCVAPLLLGGWTLLDSHERALWRSYSRNIDDQVLLHRKLAFPTQSNEPDPKYAYFEGVDVDAAAKMTSGEKDRYSVENGNFCRGYKLIVGQNMPIPLLGIFCCVFVGAAFLWFCRRNRPVTGISIERSMLFGYALYMFSDFCSPVSRYQYPAVQWLFPLLLAAAVLDGKQRAAIWWLLVGLLLNILHSSYLKINNTAGECIFMVVLFILSLQPKQYCNE